LKDEIEKTKRLKKDTKNNMSQLELARQTHDPGHEIRIIS
jgi:hypothetical protein